jgi:SAM-dependent methyltransferase
MTATEKFYDPDWRDRLFQRWHGIDVEGILPVEAIASPDLAQSSRGTFYQPIPVRYLKRILRSARATGVPFRNFVDMGCGKGKACLYMGRTGAFRRVIGVDISPNLLAAARDNRTHMGGVTPIDFIEADAQTYRLPDGPSLVFLFNPFDAIALSRFIAYNLDHFRKAGSIIAYGFDIEREVLAKHGFYPLWRDAKKRLSFHAIQ